MNVNEIFDDTVPWTSYNVLHGVQSLSRENDNQLNR